jgi:hypothetical protein
MNILNKTLLSVALTACLGIVSTSAMALPPQLYLGFTVDENNTGSLVGNVVADKIIGNYSEIVTLNSATNTFQASIVWDASQLVNVFTNNSANVVNTTTGKQLWLVDQFIGTYAPSGGNTIFTTTGPGLGLQVYYTASVSPTINTPPADGSVFWTSNLDPTKVAVATGTTTGGFGQAANAGSGFGIGFFSELATFALVNNNYFTSPNPFYNISFQTGQFNSLTPVSSSGTFSTLGSNGSMDVIFNTVPEPEILALVGVGLLGLALRRRKQA